MFESEMLANTANRPVRGGLQRRRTTPLVAASVAIVGMFGLVPGLVCELIPALGDALGTGSTAVAAVAQELPPRGRPATPPARPATPPAATPPATGDTADDLPEGLRVRPVPPRRPVTGGAGVHFEVLDHHFGKMTNAETKHYTFAFVNTGDVPLLLQDVVAACACTRPNFERREYAPGERGVIDVAFTPPTGGHQAKAMSVITNALAPNSLVRIRVIGDVEAVLSFEPRVHDVGEIEMGKPYATTFEIVADAETTYFDRVTSRGAAGIVVNLVGDAPQRGKAALAVAFPPTLPWGRITQGAAIVSTRGTTDEQSITKDLPLRVIGVAVDDIRADEYTIQIGFVDPAAAFEGETRVFHKDGKQIELVDVRMEPMSASMRGVADAEYRVDVRPSTDPEKPGQILRVRGQSRGPVGFLSGEIKFRVRVDGTVVGGDRAIGINGRVAEPERQIPMTPAR